MKSKTPPPDDFYDYDGLSKFERMNPRFDSEKGRFERTKPRFDSANGKVERTNPRFDSEVVLTRYKIGSTDSCRRVSSNILNIKARP